MDQKFLLKSDCHFLINNFINKLKLNYPKLNLIYCNDTDRFIESITEQNIFNDDKRIIILKELDPDFVDSVGAVINQPTEDIWVVIQQQTISRTKAYTVIKGACKLVELKELDENQCAVWVRQWLNDLKLIFQDDIPAYIVSRVGTDILKLNSEVEKVALYYQGSTERTLSQFICDKFFSEDAEIRFFILIEHFFRKRVKEVFDELKRFDDYSYVKLIHMLISQTEKVYKVAIYKSQGISLEDMSSLIGIPKFIISTKFITTLSFFNKIKLIELLDTLNKLDAELRSTKFPKNIVIESYLLKAMKA
jgi:DNA polymerase-3 subunit delta